MTDPRLRPALALAALLATLLTPPADARRLSLADAVAIARDSTAAVDLAALRQDEARARLGQARSVLLPSLSGSAAVSSRTFNLATLGISLPETPGAPISNEVGPIDNLDARLKASQPVFDPSGWAKLGAARRGLDQARADRDLAGEVAAQVAALAYLRAARAQAVLGAREADAALAVELAALADAQVEVGTSPRIDAVRARTQVAAAEGARLMARNALERTRIDLARSLGIDPSERIELADTLEAGAGRSAAPEVPDAALALARERRAELASERARRSRAAAERRGIAWERAGHVDAAADWGPSGTSADDAIATRQVSVAWTVPLLDGFRREGRLAEQAAIVRESEVRARDLDAQIAAEVHQALLDLASGAEQQRVAAEQLALADEEIAQARERFVAGIAGTIEVINAQTSMIRARDADIDARYAIATARVAVARATGVARTLHGPDTERTPR